MVSELADELVAEERLVVGGRTAETAVCGVSTRGGGTLARFLGSVRQTTTSALPGDSWGSKAGDTPSDTAVKPGLQRPVKESQESLAQFVCPFVNLFLVTRRSGNWRAFISW